MRLLVLLSLITFLFPREVVAVLDLEPAGLTKEEATILTQRLTSKLIALDKYVVVERNSVNKILEEQNALVLAYNAEIEKLEKKYILKQNAL